VDKKTTNLPRKLRNNCCTRMYHEVRERDIGQGEGGSGLKLCRASIGRGGEKELRRVIDGTAQNIGMEGGKRRVKMEIRSAQNNSGERETKQRGGS